MDIAQTKSIETKLRTLTLTRINRPAPQGHSLLPVSLDHQPDVYHRNSFHLLLLSLVSLQNSGDENRIHVFLLVVTLPSGSLSEVRP
jgi:hypothetical protein